MYINIQRNSRICITKTNSTKNHTWETQISPLSLSYFSLSSITMTQMSSTTAISQTAGQIQKSSEVSCEICAIFIPHTFQETRASK